MGRTRHEVSRFRERRDHPAGRAIAFAGQSHLPAKRTLDKLGIPRATFYRWYDRYREGGIEALTDHRSRPDRVWNCIPDDVCGQIIALALELPELSPRKSAAVSHTFNMWANQALMVGTRWAKCRWGDWPDARR